MSKVSVIVPVYNTPQEMVDECLTSIKSQSYKDVELIVIEDKGTGAAAARNRGLEKATGELVMFVDADDYLADGAIQTMVSGFSTDLVVGSFVKFGKWVSQITPGPGIITQVMSMKEVAEYAIGNLRQPRKNQMLSGCWAKLYKRKLVGRFPEIATAEDMAFNYDYLTRCNSVEFIGPFVYFNRKRDGSLSTTFNENDRPGLFGFLEGLKSVRRFLRKYYDESELDKAIDNSKVYHTMLYLARICDYYGCSPREAMMKVYPT